jgi:putative ABC transport system permease protein
MLRFGGVRGVPLGWRLISRDAVRFAITVSGTGAALALMLFLAGAYDGVKHESNDYVASRPVAAWVSQGSTTNLIRGTSFIHEAWRDMVAGSPSVASSAPLLRVIVPVAIRGMTYTSFICGVDPSAPATRPALVEGRADLGPDEMVVDRAFSRRARIAIGDVVALQRHEFRVVGISKGTNAVLTQMLFVRLADLQPLLPEGLQHIVSFILVTGQPGAPPDAVAADVRALVPELSVFTEAEFTENNLEELRSSLLPILATVAVFGAAIGVTVLTLLLYSSVLERREDYALLKALGTNRGYLRRLVFMQCFFTVTGGFLVAEIVCAAATPIIGYFVPVLVFSFTARAGVLIAVAALAMGAAGAWLPVSKLERIYPAEVFRA